MRRSLLPTLALIAATAGPAVADVPVTLRGSPASMARQNDVAKANDYSFVRTAGQLEDFERKGLLVGIEGNGDYAVAEFVSHPVGRPELQTFIERLAAQYHAATGEKLVVTSVTRPVNEQPGNSHALSVHPTGMAVDLRVSRRAASRQWLEGTLLSLEEQGLLDVTREFRPPHYHVAVFPGPYMAHVARLVEREEAEREARISSMLPTMSLASSGFLRASGAPTGVQDAGVAPLPLSLATGVVGLVALLLLGVPRGRAMLGTLLGRIRR